MMCKGNKDALRRYDDERTNGGIKTWFGNKIRKEKALKVSFRKSLCRSEEIITRARVLKPIASWWRQNRQLSLSSTSPRFHRVTVRVQSIIVTKQSLTVNAPHRGENGDGKAIATREVSLPLLCEDTKAFTLKNRDKNSWFDWHGRFLPMVHEFRRNTCDFMKNKSNFEEPLPTLSREEIWDRVGNLPKYEKYHICGSKHISGKDPHATTKVLGQYLKNSFPNGKGPSTREMPNQLLTKLGVMVSYWKIYTAMGIPRTWLGGNTSMDRHPSIPKTSSIFYTLAHFGCCIRHLEDNIQNNFHNERVVTFSYRAVRAYNREEFLDHFNQITDMHPKAAEHLYVLVLRDGARHSVWQIGGAQVISYAWVGRRLTNRLCLGWVAPNQSPMLIVSHKNGRNFSLGYWIKAKLSVNHKLAAMGFFSACASLRISLLSRRSTPTAVFVVAVGGGVGIGGIGGDVGGGVAIGGLVVVLVALVVVVVALVAVGSGVSGIGCVGDLGVGIGGVGVGSIGGICGSCWWHWLVVLVVSGIDGVYCGYWWYRYWWCLWWLLVMVLVTLVGGVSISGVGGVDIDGVCGGCWWCLLLVVLVELVGTIDIGGICGLSVATVGILLGDIKIGKSDTEERYENNIEGGGQGSVDGDKENESEEKEDDNQHDDNASPMGRELILKSQYKVVKTVSIDRFQVAMLIDDPVELTGDLVLKCQLGKPFDEFRNTMKNESIDELCKKSFFGYFLELPEDHTAHFQMSMVYGLLKHRIKYRANKLLKHLKNKTIPKKYKEQLCLVWFAHSVILARDVNKVIENDLLKLAEDFEKFNYYTSGYNSYNLIVKYLLSKLSPKTITLFSFPWAFMDWVFEVIPPLRKQVKDYPNEVYHTRILRWLDAKSTTRIKEADLFNLLDDAVVHPWIVPTEQELGMTSFVTLGLVDTVIPWNNILENFLNKFKSPCN
ncbi:putative glycerol-3-phosphate 2-O-acyltransferase 6-like [Capsicum annuum]|nr:putative glycerol-3-phosphate 2-O-acyltransferase 6-like [Capsicum annuum]